MTEPLCFMNSCFGISRPSWLLESHHSWAFYLLAIAVIKNDCAYGFLIDQLGRFMFASSWFSLNVDDRFCFLVTCYVCLQWFAGWQLFFCGLYARIQPGWLRITFGFLICQTKTKPFGPRAQIFRCIQCKPI